MPALENNDVQDLLDQVGQRLQKRMEGLSDAEWEWRPSAADADISVQWHEVFRTSIGDGAVDFDAEIGPVAGPFESATRRSIVLHIADELVHHGAEAALLRDLYPRGDQG